MDVPALINSADSWERRVILQGKGFGWLHKHSSKYVKGTSNQKSADLKKNMNERHKSIPYES
jgi:hypothetical protein